MNKPQIDVCLSPNLIELYDLQGKIVVIVDILRATSVMVTALANGAKSVIPVADLEEAKTYQANGFLCAAERGGAQVEGFPLGNSPFSYMGDDIKDKEIVLTTTNGTLAISKSSSADEILIGAFLNLSALADYINTSGKDLLIHCAGWKGKTNMEDTLFAGALIEKLTDRYELACDTPHMALTYYQSVNDQLTNTITNSAHAKRLNRLQVIEDIKFCAEIDTYSVVPILDGKRLRTL